MPSLLREFQAFEEDRIQFLKTNLQKFASFYNEFPPFVEKVAKASFSEGRSLAMLILSCTFFPRVLSVVLIMSMLVKISRPSLTKTKPVLLRQLTCNLKNTHLTQILILEPGRVHRLTGEARGITFQFTLFAPFAFVFPFPAEVKPHHSTRSVTSSGGGSQQFSRSASGSSTPAPAAVEATRSAIVVDDSLSASDKAAKLNDQLSQLKDSIKV